MKKALRLYAIISEFIIVTIGLGIGGYYLGQHLKPEGDLNVILGSAGIGLSFFVNIIMIYQVMKSKDGEEDA